MRRIETLLHIVNATASTMLLITVGIPSAYDFYLPLLPDLLLALQPVVAMFLIAVLLALQPVVAMFLIAGVALAVACVLRGVFQFAGSGAEGSVFNEEYFLHTEGDLDTWENEDRS